MISSSLGTRLSALSRTTLSFCSPSHAMILVDEQKPTSLMFARDAAFARSCVTNADPTRPVPPHTKTSTRSLM